MARASRSSSTAGRLRARVEAAGSRPLRALPRSRREIVHCVRDGAIRPRVLARRSRTTLLEEEREGCASPGRGAAQRARGAHARQGHRGAGERRGESVVKGQELLVVEAMKMENALRAPRDGRVKAVLAKAGDMVSPGRRPRGAGVTAAMTLPARVTVVEVGPRDGLQNEAVTALRRRPRGVRRRPSWRRAFPVVEVGAFVSPKWVPQMAGSDEVLRRVAAAVPGVRLPVLVPNRQGLPGRARRGGARDRGLHRRQRDLQPQEHQRHDRRVASPASPSSCPRRRSAGLWVRGYVSTCFGCPYEGRVAPEKVVEVAPPAAGRGLRRGLHRRHHRGGGADAKCTT